MEGLDNHYREERPWGDFERFTLNEVSTLKVITVSPNQQLSLQAHEHRDEFWRVLQGSGSVVVGEETILAPLPAIAGDSFYIPRGTKHRVAGGEQGLVFLEVALGHFDEADNHRFEDRYGRT